MIRNAYRGLTLFLNELWIFFFPRGFKPHAHHYTTTRLDISSFVHQLDMAECNEYYQYRPLVEPGTIRLIELHPSEDEAAIVQCRLVHTTLRQAQEEIVGHYTALSYVWGDPNDTTTILTNGRLLRVTKSLESALRHLRDDKRTFNVWADGVCINQKDDDEKSTQVQQMGEVYETAHHTIIFLGECNSSTEAVLAGMLSSLEEKSPIRRDSEVQVALKDILHRPWFYRVWIFQELVMSRDPRVQVGHTRFSWDTLYHFINPTSGQWPKEHSKSFGMTSQKLESHFGTDAEVISQMHKGRAKYEQSRIDLKYPENRNSKASTHKHFAAGTQTWSSSATSPKQVAFKSFFDILSSRRGFGASDTRDLVFAHVGMVLNLDVRVDYKLTTAQVYEKVAQDHVKTFQNFDILSYIEEIELENRMPGLASWAPDWSCGHPSKRITEYVAEDQSNLVPRSRIFHWLTQSNILCSIAYPVSSVKEVSCVVDSVEYKSPLDEEFEQRIRIQPVEATHPKFVKWEAQAWFPYRYNWWRARLGSSQNILPPLPTVRYRRTGPPESSIEYMGNNQPGSEPDSDSVHNIQVSSQHKLSQPNFKPQYLVDHLILRLEHPHSGSIIDGRRLARLDSDRLALVPASAKQGDSVYFLKGCAVPLVVRDAHYPDTQSLDGRISSEMGGMYTWLPSAQYVKIVGECFVEGLMYGTGLHRSSSDPASTMLAIL
jgi:hypothetical protein